MALHDKPDDAYLIARSADEAFPADALSEIRQERLLGADQEADFPACKVEIVLGAKGRLFVVLPTGVETSLPFACNAPFIQDPARLKIKDPETSPTNRWLLERVGSLAASVMLQWLRDSNASLVERSRAYELFPNVDRDDNSLEGTCATTVEETFDAAIEGQAFLLTNDGELNSSGQSVVFPEAMFEVWPAEQVASPRQCWPTCAVPTCVRRRSRKAGAMGRRRARRQGTRPRCPPIEASTEAGDLAPSSEIMGVRRAGRHRLAHDGQSIEAPHISSSGQERPLFGWRGREIGGKAPASVGGRLGVSVRPPACTEPKLDALHHGAAQVHRRR